MRLAPLLLLLSLPTLAATPLPDGPPPPLPASAKLALDENWSTGKVDPAVWYPLRRQWGKGNHGVVPENLSVTTDTVAGRQQNVLVCRAHGDLYDGPIVGKAGKKPRVGAVLVTRQFFASGRYEVVLKIGADKPHPGGPKDPARPIGLIASVWTYSYQYLRAPKGKFNEFVPGFPPYNPWVQRPPGVNEYWAELDFPEFGKGGDFDKALYNTFLQTRHHPEIFDVRPAIDGQYHTLTTDWRTELRPILNVTDAQVTEQGGYHWVNDRAVSYDAYLGNPLKRLAKDRYAVYAGKSADHWIDGKPVARNVKYVPSMAGQLNVGVWLPDWAGPAPWQTAEVRIASVKIWQYHDAGDVRGVLTKDITDTLGKDGRPLK